MVNLVPHFVRKTWHIWNWNIPGLVLISFAVQVCLLLFAPLRKRSNKSIVTWFLWSAYLFADYIATFCIGLIFDKRGTFSDNFVHSYILVFWAPFLLLHLGGPDTITAFALEDNELWLRHLLGLVFQVGATVYLFFLTIPGNTLWIPTTLVFVVGMIKYIERTRSLFLASMNTIRKSVKNLDTRGPILAIDYAKNMEMYFNPRGPEPAPMFENVGYPTLDRNASHVDQLLRLGFNNFSIFKWLFVDKTLNFDVHRNLLRTYFLNITPENALIAAEAELNLMYEFFFTKASVLWTKVGCLLRLASFISTVAALLVFVTHKKHGFNKSEIEVTYTLLLGAVALDTMALLRLIFSDWSIITCSFTQYSAVPRQIIPKLAYNLKANLSKFVLIPFLEFRKPRWSNCMKEPYTKFRSLSTSLLFRKWSGTISGHDFIQYCLHKTEEGKQSTGNQSKVVVKFLKQRVHQVIDFFGAEELVDTWIYKANNPFLKELWEFIFMELKNKSEHAGENKEIVDRICKATGEWVLLEQRGKLDQQMIHGLMPYVNSDEVGSFGERIMIWHIATGLCYYADSEADQNYACLSKLISDYMMYLLVMEPSVISAAAGIERSMILRVTSNLVDACGVVTKFCRMENQNQESFAQSACQAMINAFSRFETDLKNKSGSLLIHACDLATKLRALLPEEKRWEKVAQIWVEMLSFVALNTKPDMHVRQLSKGGQLISFVWLLMLHMGLGGHQFRKIRPVREDGSEPEGVGILYLSKQETSAAKE